MTLGHDSYDFNAEDQLLRSVLSIGHVSGELKKICMERVLQVASDQDHSSVSKGQSQHRRGYHLALLTAAAVTLMAVAVGAVRFALPAAAPSATHVSAAERMLGPPAPGVARHVIASTEFAYPSPNSPIHGTTELFQRTTSDGVTELAVTAYSSDGSAVARLIQLDDVRWIDVDGEVHVEGVSNVGISPEAAAGLNVIHVSSPEEMLAQLSSGNASIVASETTGDGVSSIRVDLSDEFSESDKQEFLSTFGLSDGHILVEIRFEADSDVLKSWRLLVQDSADHEVSIYVVEIDIWATLAAGDVSDDVFSVTRPVSTPSDE